MMILVVLSRQLLICCGISSALQFRQSDLSGGWQSIPAAERLENFPVFSALRRRLRVRKRGKTAVAQFMWFIITGVFCNAFHLDREIKRVFNLKNYLLEFKL